MKKAILISMLTLVLSGCFEQKIDSSSEASFVDSVESMAKGLPEERKKKFLEALKYLSLVEFQNSGVTNIFEMAAVDTTGHKIKFRESVDGKTVDEIIQKAVSIAEEKEQERKLQKIKQLEERIKSLREEVNKLEGDKAKAKSDKIKLQNINVSSSRFFYQKNEYNMVKPNISLAIINNTNHAISRVYFDALLTSPNRSIPWVDTSFNYEINGGIEPGEGGEVTLSPNMFGEWSKPPQNRTDYILSLVTTRVDGANGEVLFDSEFPDYQQELLSELLTSIEEAEAELNSLQGTKVKPSGSSEPDKATVPEKKEESPKSKESAVSSTEKKDLKEEPKPEINDVGVENDSEVKDKVKHDESKAALGSKVEIKAEGMTEVLGASFVQSNSDVTTWAAILKNSSTKGMKNVTVQVKFLDSNDNPIATARSGGSCKKPNEIYAVGGSEKISGVAKMTMKIIDGKEVDVVDDGQLVVEDIKTFFEGSRNDKLTTSFRVLSKLQNEIDSFGYRIVYMDKNGLPIAFDYDLSRDALSPNEKTFVKDTLSGWVWNSKIAPEIGRTEVFTVRGYNYKCELK